MGEAGPRGIGGLFPPFIPSLYVFAEGTARRSPCAPAPAGPIPFSLPFPSAPSPALPALCPHPHRRRPVPLSGCCVSPVSTRPPARPPRSLAAAPRPPLTCRGSAARSCRRGRAARSARRGSLAGRRTGRRRRCSGRARTRTHTGTRDPTGPAGRRSGRSPARTASRGRRSGSCSGGPTSPARSGRSRWFDRSAPPPGCTGTDGGRWVTTSRARSGTRPSRRRNARGGCSRTGTRNGCPSVPPGSGTRPWPARTGRVGGRRRSHGNLGPSTDSGSLQESGGEHKGVSGLRARHGSPPRAPFHKEERRQAHPPRAGDRPLNIWQPNLLGHSSLPASDSRTTESLWSGPDSHFILQNTLKVPEWERFAQSHTAVGFHSRPFLSLMPIPLPSTPTPLEMTGRPSVHPCLDTDHDGHKRSHISPPFVSSQP